MNTVTVSIRELRTDFRSVKRKIEQFGKVTITDHGVPSFDIIPSAMRPKKRCPLPDYYSRLVEEQPVPMTAEQSRRLHEENRGDR
jgi:antitoxin (DNA-binding transcriptional repressor) of toxin-antitoxin stability system